MVERIDVTWSQRERPLIACQGVGVTAEILQCQALIVVRGGVVRPLRQDRLERGKRLLVAFERVEDHAIVGERVRRSRLRGERRGDEAQGLGRTPLLVPKHADQMQRIEVAGIGRQRRFVEASGLVEVPLPMQRQRLLDIMCRLRLPRGRGPVHAWSLRRTRMA
jgi:hypothetical protein